MLFMPYPEVGRQKKTIPTESQKRVLQKTKDTKR